MRAWVRACVHACVCLVIVYLYAFLSVLSNCTSILLRKESCLLNVNCVFAAMWLSVFCTLFLQRHGLICGL